MTISEAKAKLVNWALAQVGYAEGANNYNKYAPDCRRCADYAIDRERRYTNLLRLFV